MNQPQHSGVANHHGRSNPKISYNLSNCAHIIPFFTIDLDIDFNCLRLRSFLTAFGSGAMIWVVFLWVDKEENEGVVDAQSATIEGSYFLFVPLSLNQWLIQKRKRCIRSANITYLGDLELSLSRFVVQGDSRIWRSTTISRSWDLLSCHEGTGWLFWTKTLLWRIPCFWFLREDRYGRRWLTLGGLFVFRYRMSHSWMKLRHDLRFNTFT